MRRNRRNDFWGSFSRSLNLQPAANIIAGSILQQKEDEKLIAQQAAEEEKQQQGRQAVMDLFSGGQNLRSPSGQEIPFIEHLQPNVPGIEGLKQGFTQTQKSTYKDYTQQEKLEKIGQIFPDPSQYFNAVSKLLNQEQKQKKTVKIGDQVFEESLEFENIPIGDALFTEPEKFQKTQTLRWDLMSKVEGSIIIPKGYYDEDENWVETDFKRIPISTKKKKESGDDYKTPSKDINKELEKFYIKQQVLSAQNKAGVKYTGGIDYDTEESEEVGNALTKNNKIYTNFVDNLMGEETKKWYRDVYNAEGLSEDGGILKVAGENPHPEDYWEKLKEDYANGEIDEYSYIILVEKFKSIYGFNPLDIYE